MGYIHPEIVLTGPPEAVKTAAEQIMAEPWRGGGDSNAYGPDENGSITITAGGYHDDSLFKQTELLLTAFSKNGIDSCWLSACSYDDRFTKVRRYSNCLGNTTCDAGFYIFDAAVAEAAASGAHDRNAISLLVGHLTHGIDEGRWHLNPREVEEDRLTEIAVAAALANAINNGGNLLPDEGGAHISLAGKSRGEDGGQEPFPL